MVPRKSKILSISLKEKKKNRYIVTTTSGDRFEVSEDVLIASSLYKNKEIAETELNKILISENYFRVKEAALVLLNYRMRSKKELRLRLIKKGYSKDIIDKVINELEKKNWIDDEKFGLAFSRDQINRNKIGPIALKYKLREFLDSIDLISQISTKIYSEIKIEDIILHLLQKYTPDNINSDEKLRRKLINKLKRKGHYWQDIDGALTKYLDL
jgi:regulatory protein